MATRCTGRHAPGPDEILDRRRRAKQQRLAGARLPRGVDGVGWEAKPHEELDEYFSYIKDYEDRLWVDTFGNVTRYMRERMNGNVQTRVGDGSITIELTHILDPEMYSLPLTLRTYVDNDWRRVVVHQGTQEMQLVPDKDARGTYVQYQAVPNGGTITIRSAR